MMIIDHQHWYTMMMMIVYWYLFSNHYTRECIHTGESMERSHRQGPPATATNSVTRSGGGIYAIASSHRKL